MEGGLEDEGFGDVEAVDEEEDGAFVADNLAVGAEEKPEEEAEEEHDGVVDGEGCPGVVDGGDG